MNELKYKLVSCDMDDTLLRHDGTLSQRNLDTIHEFERRGGVFMANTGRMYASVIPRVRELNLINNSPVSALQGALVRESKTDKQLFLKPLSYEQSLSLVTEAEKLGIFIQVYDDKNLYCVKPDGQNGTFAKGYAERCGVEYVYVPDLIGFVRERRMECVKMIMVDEPAKVQQYLKYFIGKYGDKVNFNTSSLYMLEAFNKDAGKDVACDIICKKMGITINECMAIGDSMNDYTMIRHAGLGVAVKNAQPDVLKIAKYITDSNDEDGVAKAIEKFCF